MDEGLLGLIRRTTCVRRIPLIKGLFSDTPLAKPILFPFGSSPFRLGAVLGWAADARLFDRTDQLLDQTPRIVAGDVVCRGPVGDDEQESAGAGGIAKNPAT